MIEEDIQHDNNTTTPLINAQTKQLNGKAKGLNQYHVPTFFQSTNLDRPKLDNILPNRNQDSKSPLSSKPFLGIGGRPKLRDSPSPIDMRRQPTPPIEEDLNPREEAKRGTKYVDNPYDFDPNQSCTSDFYQVPVAGGVPAKLTIDNSRRPFTPPFVQLNRKGEKLSQSKQPEYISNK